MKQDVRQKIEHIAVDALIPYAKNSRTHSEAQVSQIAGSIREFGFTNPVLIDAGDGIIAGHGRVLAAHKLNLVDIPCVRLSHLTDTQRRAYIIADNKLALNAEWDGQMLSYELKDLHESDFNMSLLGFDADELVSAMGFAEFASGSEDEQGQLDEKQQIACPACGHEFHK